MNNENLNAQDQNPEQIVERRVYRQTNSGISGLTRAGLILSIVGSSIFIFIGLIIIFNTLRLVNEITAIYGDSAYAAIQIAAHNSTFAIMGILFLAGPITSIIINSLALKSQTNGLVIAAGVLGIFCGPLIGGILTLAGRNQN